MSTHTKPKTRRQLRHPGSRSKSHGLDKQEGEKRKETSFIGVDAPQRPSSERSFSGLTGHEFIREGNAWRRCDDPEELANYLEKENKRRSWFMDTTQRKGVAVEMLRRVKAALEVLTVTFSPWLNDWTEAELKAQRDPRKALAQIRNRLTEAAQKVLSGERHLLAVAVHCDTADIHIDLVASRYSGDGERIGENGLGLCGPWVVGCDRQMRAGAEISAEKRNQMRRAVANHRRRHGEGAIPLDVQLARELDQAAAEVIGPELQPYREAYARKVPELERAHKRAQLSIVQDVEEKLRESLEPEPSPEAKQLPEPRPAREIPVPDHDFPSLG